MLLYIPTKVYSENDCVRNHGRELASYGKKALIVTGKYSSKKNGSLADVTEALEQMGVDYVVFEDIEENPSVETVMSARDFGIKEHVDFVIGIGGGSPLDASKAIAIMIANPDANSAVLYENRVLKHLPVISVPTTCGTGSEVTPYAILTLHKERTKRGISHRVFPELALLDATYLKTMSRSNLINTAVDALAHLVESYLNTNANELNKTYSREGLRTWASISRPLASDTLTDEDFTKLMHASMLGGMAISHTGTSLPHGLSYSVTYELGVPHGKAVGMFLGKYVKMYQAKEDAGQVLQLLGFADADAFESYLQELLGKVEVDEALMLENAKGLLQNPAKLKNYPYAVTVEELVNMAN